MIRADMSAASVDLLDLPDGLTAEGGRVPDPAVSDRKQPDTGSLSSAGSADDEGDLLELIPEKSGSAASDHHPDGMKSAPLLFERISEEEKGSSDASSQEKGSDKGSTGSQESDEESSKRSSAERESAPSPSNRPPAVGPKSTRPCLTRMTAVHSSIKSSKKSCIKETAAKADIEETAAPFEDVEAEEKARVREGMHTILKSFSGPADPFAATTPQPAAPLTPQPGSLAQVSPAKVQRLLPVKPAPERLLPIGPPREPSPKPVLLKSHAAHDTRDPAVTPVERLLPIGPPRDRSKSPAGAYKKLVSPAATPECGLFFDPLPTCQPPPKPPRLHQRQQAEVIIPIESDVVKHEKSPPDEGKAGDNLAGAADDAGAQKDKQEEAGGGEARAGKPAEGKEVSSESQSEVKKKEKKKRTKEGKKSGESRKKALKQDASRQATLESLGHSISLDMDNLSEAGQKPAGRQYKQRRQQRREAQQSQSRSLDNKSVSGSCGGVAAGVQRRARKAENTTAGNAATATANTSGKRTSVSQASIAGERSGGGTAAAGSDEGVINQRCAKCSNVIEEFSEEEIGMCIVILRTYVHRESGMAAPLLPEMLKLVARFTSYFPNAWQYERSVVLPVPPNL